MPITDAELIGYKGRVDEVAWARLNRVQEGHVAGLGDWKPTALEGVRQVSVAAGAGRDGGIYARTSEAVVVTPPVPDAGRWYLLTAYRRWIVGGEAVRDFDFRLVPGDETSQTVPTSTPVLLPAGLANQPGVELDQPLAWVWVAANQSEARVFDRRRVPGGLVQSTIAAAGWGGRGVKWRQDGRKVDVLVDHATRTGGTLDLPAWNSSAGVLATGLPVPLSEISYLEALTNATEYGGFAFVVRLNGALALQARWSGRQVGKDTWVEGSFHYFTDSEL